MPNVTCIVGNHEYAFLKYYWGLMRQATGDYDAVLKKLQDYFTDGSLLDWDIIDRFEGLPCYVEENEYFGVHAGIPIRADRTLVHPKEAMTEHLVYDRDFKEFGTKIAPTEKCVLYGHTPTRYLTNTDNILFHRREGIKTPVNISDYARIHLDTGVSVSGVLGCLCIEDCKCYYVKNCLEGTWI